MSKSEPLIKKYMACQPIWIEASLPLGEAKELMREKGIRHLPVMCDGKVLGILSERDIKATDQLLSSEAKALKVSDVCHHKPHVTRPEATLREVAREMAEHKVGSMIVMDGAQLVGIFTAVDACAALADILGQRYHDGSH